MSLVVLIASWGPTALAKLVGRSLWPLIAGVMLLDFAVQAVHVSNQHFLTAAHPDRTSTVIGAYMAFQIASNANGVDVLDANGTDVTKSPRTTDVFAITGTDPDQEWDVLPAGNCGDTPANCNARPTVSHGDGDYYVIVNKATGNVLTATPSGIAAESPAAASNGDWIEPAVKGQLWRIVPARITG